MTWVKLDDQFSEHPKVLAAGPAAMWLFVCGLCYCGRQLTDGRIPKSMLPRLADVKNPTRLAARLVEVGLWHDEDDDFLVHDFLAHNPSRQDVEKRRADNRDRQKKSRSQRQSQRDEDVTDGVTHSAPTRPDPSRPLPSDARKPEDDDPHSLAGCRRQSAIRIGMSGWDTDDWLLLNGPSHRTTQSPSLPAQPASRGVRSEPTSETSSKCALTPRTRT